MKNLFDFKRMLLKYGVNCQLLAASSGGDYVGGEWVPEPDLPPVTISGILIPMQDRKIYQSGGTYTEQDREFITEQGIPLEPAAYIAYKGVRYHVESENDYSEYAGFHDYNLKRVGVFDRPGKD